MHVQRLGRGDVTIVLHGFAGSGDEMLDLARRLPGRKLVPDLPGHGRSPAPDVAEPYRMESVVQELLRLLDEESARTADVVGYSMGGRVALGLAAAAPARISSVVAIGGRAGIPDSAERGARKRADDELAATIESRGAEWFAEEWIQRPLYDTQRRLGEEHMAAVLARRRRVDPVGLANSLRELGAGAQPVVIDDLARSGVRVVLIVGAEDPRFRAAADEIAAAVPSARVVVIPDAGHATHVEALDATAAALLDAQRGAR